MLGAKKSTLPIIYVALLSMQVPFHLIFFKIALTIQLESVKNVMRWIYLVIVLCHIIAVGIVGILNIIRSFNLYKNNEVNMTIRSMLIVKYGLVPFYIVNFIFLLFLYVVMILGASAMFAFVGFSLMMVLIIGGVIGAWLTMIPGLFYSIQVIRFTEKSGKTGSVAKIWHILLQLFFLADVLDTMYLAVVKWNKGKIGAVIIGLLYILVLGNIVAFFL